MKQYLNKRWVLTFALALIMAFVILYGRGLSDKGSNEGLVVLSNVGLIQDRGKYFLDAKVDIDLPRTIKAGLDSGVPLVFVLTIQFLKPSRYWFNKQIETLEHRFSLTYYELTRHYRVRRLATNTHRNYRSLSSALRGLGAIESLPLDLNNTSFLLSDVDSASTPVGDALVASLDFRLDSRSLPLPLQPVFTSSWRLASKEFTWPVN